MRTNANRNQEVRTVRRLFIFGVILLVAVVGVAIAVAATRGGGSASTSGATVSAKSIAGHGKVLVDARGDALYRSEQEQKGMVLCTGACLSFWQPLTTGGTPHEKSLAGKLGTVKRPDGARQVTYQGKLLYAFKLDKPGNVSGDGFKDAFGGQKFTWHVVRPVGTAVAATPAPTTPSYTYPGS
jgi:predicted lipoprotein with Yx(FWY)xxD motif